MRMGRCFFVFWCLICWFRCFGQFVPWKLDEDGNLLAADDLRAVLDRQISFYVKVCGHVNASGYPIWIANAFADGQCRAAGLAVLPGIGPSQALQALIAYLSLSPSNVSQSLHGDVSNLCTLLARYIMKETLTPAYFAWPSVPRSTGISSFPITVSAQGDALFGPDTIEPDKSAMAGYALGIYSKTFEDVEARNMSIHIARVLAKNMRLDAGQHLAPWSFRVNARTGVSYYAKMSNSAYVLRLLDFCVEEFDCDDLVVARDFLRNWIIKYQIYSGPDPESSLFVGFFEDFIDTDEVNRFEAFSLFLFFLYKCQIEIAGALWN